jgi:D-psicose/D-tagatose/L-ribulose 3-epimerase
MVIAARKSWRLGYRLRTGWESCAEWGRVFEAIRETGFGGWLTIESFGSNAPEIATAAAIWRDLAVTTEAVAFDGIGFLREMAAGPPAAH